jgi:hypothetical protein
MVRKVRKKTANRLQWLTGVDFYVNVSINIIVARAFTGGRKVFA